MMNIGIRLHDTAGTLLEERLDNAKAQGFTCAHLAMQKALPDFRMADAPALLTDEVAARVREAFAARGMGCAVLGCYLNLATPDEEQYRKTLEIYFAHLRFGRLIGAAVVGTETGAPNAEYKLDADTHTDGALHTFLRNLEPVVECAEHCGITMAIEPVWNHIVYSADRAVEVLRGIGSRNLRIIFDPVNLLSTENADDRERLLGDAMDKLCDSIAMVHLKDFVRADGKLVSVAAGTGEMDYRAILSFLKARKPFIQATLENTCNENAVSSRRFLEEIYASV
jgi:sugar phosphate isomerase/epimerase